MRLEGQVTTPEVGGAKEAMAVTQTSCPTVEDITVDLQTFYRENVGPIYRYVLSKVGNREEAEDLTSHIFLKAVRGLKCVREVQSMRNWLYQVARTTIVDYWRSHHRVITSSLDVLVDAGWEESTEVDLFGVTGKPAERIQHILQALPPHYRQVLTCRFLLGLSVRETAHKLSLTEENVRALQVRALKRAANVEASERALRSK
jgi:RNA polymerase sigma-70 factor (ECF subfamily)